MKNGPRQLTPETTCPVLSYIKDLDFDLGLQGYLIGNSSNRGKVYLYEQYILNDSCWGQFGHYVHLGYVSDVIYSEV